MPFASAVTYFQEHDLDLNRYLQPHPLSTYFLVVDRSRNAAPGCLIIAELNGELLARRLLFKGKHPLLGTDNPQSPPCPLREDDSFAVWGVVTSVIRKLL